MNASMEPDDLLPLTHLSYHVLLALTGRPLHGYGIIKEIEARTDGDMEVEAGTLYAALKRMEEEGLLEDAPAPPDDPGDSRRRYYRLTGFGREVLEAESRRLQRLLDLAREKSVLPAPESGT